jgi:hypothetical protein
LVQALVFINYIQMRVPDQHITLMDPLQDQISHIHKVQAQILGTKELALELLALEAIQASVQELHHIRILIQISQVKIHQDILHIQINKVVLEAVLVHILQIHRHIRVLQVDQVQITLHHIIRVQQIIHRDQVDLVINLIHKDHQVELDIHHNNQDKVIHKADHIQLLEDQVDIHQDQISGKELEKIF